jgi:hypothetical protein
MSKAYNEYLKSEYWKSVTAAVKARAGYRCQLCNSQHDLQAHHRTYDHRGKELEHLDDLTCLCRRCHAVFHGVLVIQPVVEPEPVKKPQERREKRVGSYDHEADMPAGDPITLTNELINRLRTDRGAFTNASIEPLDVPRPLLSGWGKRLVGKIVTREVYRRCLRGREVYV